MRLIVRLLVLGVIENGCFIWMKFRHDDQCKMLRTSDGADCRCNCEAHVNGQSYSYEQFVAQAERVQ